MDITKIYSTSLKAEGKSKNTIKNYLVAVNQFLRAHNGCVDAITQESVDSFLSKFNSRNQTQNFKKNAVHKFLSFFLDRGQIKTIMNTKMKNVTIGEPEFLTPAEQVKLFTVLQSKPKFKFAKHFYLSEIRHRDKNRTSQRRNPLWHIWPPKLYINSGSSCLQHAYERPEEPIGPTSKVTCQWANELICISRKGARNRLFYCKFS